MNDSSNISNKTDFHPIRALLSMQNVQMVAKYELICVVEKLSEQQNDVLTGVLERKCFSASCLTKDFDLIIKEINGDLHSWYALLDVVEGRHKAVCGKTVNFSSEKLCRVSDF